MSGGRGRPDRKPVLHANEEPALAGCHITDCQMRLYMSFRETETAAIAAAKAGFSAATAYRPRTGPPAAVAKASAAWSPATGSAGRSLGQRGGAVAKKACRVCGQSPFSRRSAGAIPRSAPASGARWSGASGAGGRSMGPIVLSFIMAYRSFGRFRQASTRLDTPPFSHIAITQFRL